MKKLSIIIPYYNDGEILKETVDNIHQTIDIDSYEVIMVNDGGMRGFDVDHHFKSNEIHMESFFNLGVGQAFDSGAKAASGDILILIGADVRFEKNGWASRMIRVVEEEEDAIICAGCKSFHGDRVYYGADIIFSRTEADLSKNNEFKGDKTFRSCFSGKWRPRTSRGVYRIPSLMGAFYGTTKEWYDRVRGFELHYKWGVLEPYISLKTWMLGGRVLVDSDNMAMHIWRKPNRVGDYTAVMYNMLIIAGTIYGGDGVRYAEFLAEGGSKHWNDASDFYNQKYEDVVDLHKYIEENKLMSTTLMEEFIESISVNDIKRIYQK